jgi:hypothetical protein
MARGIFLPRQNYSDGWLPAPKSLEISAFENLGSFSSLRLKISALIFSFFFIKKKEE